MEPLILQFALAFLICTWWIKPLHSIRLTNRFKISAFNFLCMLSLLFLGSYTVLHEASNNAGGLYSILFLAWNVLLFLMIPSGFLYLRNNFQNRKLSRADLIHLLPCLVFVTWLVIPWFTDTNPLRPGSTMVSSKSFFNIYAYCTIGVYIVLILKFVLYRLMPMFNSQKTKKLFPGYASGKSMQHVKPEISEIQTGSIHFDTGQLLKMDETLKSFISTRHPYLRQGYNLKQLSDDTAIPLHHLSAFINQYYHLHFNDFINEYRVQYCQLKIRNEEWRSKTLEAIAEESGFNNRNTFTAAFKKCTGTNPSDYLKMVKEKKIA